MVIRGAPAIGAAAGYGLALAANRSNAQSVEALETELNTAADCLRAARPTAVNLFWGIERVINKFKSEHPHTVKEAQEVILQEAKDLADEDARQNRQIGLNGLAVIPEKANIVHHCNTGALATVEYGTALGVIRAAHEHGKNIHVYVDETRPRLQGARLTAWELQQLGIPYKVIVDGASGFFMRAGKVDLCLVGCDRVAANGDTANKIGTYNLALAAHAHQLPFYVVGPTSTVDLSIPSGNEIPIENRPDEEITRVGMQRIMPEPMPVENPAFDVTPARFITGIITEKGIAYPPYEESLARLFKIDG
jgi:methylthioribose-1-phosphate isomerase